MRICVFLFTLFETPRLDNPLFLFHKCGCSISGFEPRDGASNHRVLTCYKVVTTLCLKSRPAKANLGSATLAARPFEAQAVAEEVPSAAGVARISALGVPEETPSRPKTDPRGLFLRTGARHGEVCCANHRWLKRGLRVLQVRGRDESWGSGTGGVLPCRATPSLDP